MENQEKFYITFLKNFIGFTMLASVVASIGIMLFLVALVFLENEVYGILLLSFVLILVLSFFKSYSEWRKQS